jgi:mannosyltransferase
MQRYEVIYNGIDIDAYAPNPQRREELRRQWGVGDDEILIAFASRLDYQKNLPMLLEAFRRLRQSRNDIRLVIAGEKKGSGAFFHQGAQHSCNTGVIDKKRLLTPFSVWLGRTDDVPGLLSAADIFVQPSRWEGFGLAAAEAMTAGLPVIGTRVPGLTELIEEGVSGLLIDSEDIDALTVTINQLADNHDERVRLGAAGQNRVKERFSIEANVTAHERLYENVCQHR